MTTETGAHLRDRCDQLSADLAQALEEIQRLKASNSQAIYSRVLAQEALDESQDRLRLAAEAAQLALWEWDVRSGKVLFTERWGMMMGDQGTALTAHVDELFARVHPEDVDRVRKAATDALSGKTERYVAEHRVRSKGGWVWIESRGLVTGRDGQDRATRMIGTNAVISERKEALEHTREARAVAERASRSKSDFVIELVRRLRVPIGSVVESIRLLDTATAPSERKRCVVDVEQAARTLEDLVADAVDYVEVEDGRTALEPRSFAMEPFLHETLAPYLQAAADKGLRISLQAPGVLPQAVVADAARLRQILSNLLSNAVKFTERGEVELAVSARPGTPGRVLLRFEVADTGAGISPALQARISEPFCQVEPAADQSHSGTGLGLALSSRLLRLMGSHLKVTSLRDRGSIFSFELDVQEEESLEQRAPASQTTALPDFAGLRVLVADDHALSEMLLRKFLIHLGCEVVSARDGRGAVYLWAQGGIDLIFMDVEMPGVSGIEATQDIRRREGAAAGGRTPIIAVTAHLAEGTSARCVAAGMDGYITKPITLDALAAAIGSALQARKAPSMLQASTIALDPGKLLERLGGDRAALADVASMVLLDLSARVPELQRAFAQQDRMSAYQQARDLKGTLESMTASRAAQMAKGLETAARQQAWDLCQRAMPLLEAELARVESALGALSHR